MRVAWLFVIFPLLAFSCVEKTIRHVNNQWVVEESFLTADPGNPVENVAVKDPTILFYGGKYHLFYTAKSKSSGTRGDEYGIGCGYRSAGSIDGLADAPRISVDALAGTPVIAPQVFYFEPQQLWYLVAHTPASGTGLHRLEPVYLTNPDIMDPDGWSEASVIKTGKTGDGFWIDFWVICDDTHAYLFYADQTGKLFRLQCAIGDFPRGFEECVPELALEVNRMDQPDGWRFFEAAHIYHVADADIYLALLEGAYAHPSREGDVDSRNRFVFGMVADSLNGEWRRLENHENTFLADARNVFYADGRPVSFTQVSHPELIRSGYDQRLEIGSFNMRLVFQTFDGSVVGDNYNYNALPWELVVMKNVEERPEASVSGSLFDALPSYDRWIVSKPVLEAGPEGAFDELSVKDPTIVFYNGKYHLFYTGKATYETRDRMPHLSKNGSGLGYVSAPTLEAMESATRYDLGLITGAVIVAPQVFFFEPQQLWYIVAQTIVDGKPDLMPVYLTNPDIEDVNGWSDPQILKTRKSNNGFWIDFWVICDEEKAHLFYTDHAGSLFRFECPLEEFPGGFEKEMEETVLTVRGENEKGRWRMHEASHIYYVKKHGHYMNIMEAVYPHPTRKNYWESRNRFLFAMVAEKLEGPWYRVENGENDFFGDPGNLYNAGGSRSVYDQVSHPELIRSGYDQRLEIEDYRLQLLFQAFDADTVGPEYDYNYLPWELTLMKNY